MPVLGWVDLKAEIEKLAENEGEKNCEGGRHSCRLEAAYHNFHGQRRVAITES